MPKINFEIPIPTDEKTAFTKIKKFLSAENDFKKFDPKVVCTFDEKNLTCRIKGSQFDAEINTMKEKDTTKVQVKIDIPLTLVLFKGKIKDIVEKNIKKVFKV
jgi:carbon monoxide dehydrogenase subunit G